MEVPNMNVDYFDSLYTTVNVNSMELLSDFSPISKLECNSTDLLDLPTGSCLGQATGSYPQYSTAFGGSNFGECESLLTAAADTLNNYGAAAYHNSLDSSFDGLHPPPAASSPYLGMKQEASFSTPCGSPFSARTPVPPPLSDTDVLPMDEPSQLLQLQELKIRSSDVISNNCVTRKHLPYAPDYEQLLQQCPSSLFTINSNNSFSESQLSPKQNYISSPLNSINDSSCSWQTPSDMYSLPQSQNDDPSSSWQVPENCLSSPHPSTQYSLDITQAGDNTDHNTSFLSSHESYSPNLSQRSPLSGDSSTGGDACSYTDDPLNIPRAELFPFHVDQSIQQLIGAEYASGSGLSGSSGHSVAADPRLWSKDDIRIWLEWAYKEFNLKRKIVSDMLPSTGAELCSLSKQQLQQRVGDEDGEELTNYLQCCLSGYGVSLPEDQLNLDPYEKYSSTCIRLSCPGSGQIQLWQFLLELLADRSNAQVITWDNSSSEFKILQPDEVARKWGERKTKPNMNYDKLSRALRYYYDRGLMVKVPGKRYAYRACFPALEALHASQQGTEPKPAVDFELFHTINSSLRSSDTPSPYR